METLSHPNLLLHVRSKRQSLDILFLNKLKVYFSIFQLTVNNSNESHKYNFSVSFSIYLFYLKNKFYKIMFDISNFAVSFKII